MISLTKGEPKAAIIGGKYHKQILYIAEPGKKCCEKCNEECKYERCCQDCEGGNCGNCIENNASDMIAEDYLRSLKKKMPKEDIYALHRSFRAGQLDENKEHLEEVYQKLITKNRDESQKEFKIWDEGILQPLPDYNKTFRSYTCGPTDSGKSYYVSKILKMMRKVEPDKKIYIFSDVDEDKALDDLGNITRVKLDEGLVKKKPIKPEALKDSICVFDDIDAIPDKKISVAIKNLRDSLLTRGRHENISTIVTNHLMTNYKDTKIVLNECSSITVFPKSGASQGIKYVLKNYCGLSKRDIDKIFDLPSRWVTVCKNSPMFVMYEKGMYLV